MSSIVATSNGADALKVLGLLSILSVDSEMLRRKGIETPKQE